MREVKQKQVESKEVEKQIDESRKGYVPVAERGAVLFFAIKRSGKSGSHVPVFSVVVHAALCVGLK